MILEVYPAVSSFACCVLYREFWRESEELEKEVNVLKTTLTKAERNLTYTMDKVQAGACGWARACMF